MLTLWATSQLRRKNGKKGEKTKVKIKEVRSRFAIGEKVGESTTGATEEVGVEESTSESETEGEPTKEPEETTEESEETEGTEETEETNESTEEE